MSKTETRISVIDHQTGLVVATYATIKRARAACTRLNLEYGACRYTVNGVAC